MNIYSAILGSATTPFDIDVSRFVMNGKVIFAMFGLPGAALAFYKTALPENKKKTGALMIALVIPCVLSGITEPLEYSFLFIAPVLYLVHAIMAGLAYAFPFLLNFNVAGSATFGGPLLSLIFNGILGASKGSGWMSILILGPIWFATYFFVFKALIKRMDLKTPGRELPDEGAEDAKAEKAPVSELIPLIIEAVGGADNIKSAEACFTRLRLQLNDCSKVADDKVFTDELEARGAEVLKQVQERGGTCVVLAARPYQTDPLVNHNLPGMFIEQGVPVLTADSVPGMREVDLTRSRLDIANNYHARILSCALIAARTDCLEFAQIASFGCGHDAYLADEAARLMHEVSAKRPLLLKVDESAAEGALRIRVRSFLETTRIRRARGDADMDEVRELPDPYPVKFTREERDTYTVLVPNTSHAFSRLMAAAFAKQGLKTASLDLGRENAIRLGKRYVHNDICFPAQIVIGEVLDALMSGRYDLDHTAVMMAKYVGDCRLTHYSALLRKALDDAGFAQIPIVTNDTADDHNLHPGIKMSPATALRIAHGLPMIDALEELLRKMRPYEKEPGASDRAFEIALDHVMEGIKRRGVRGGLAGFRRGIQVMSEVEIDRSHPRPTVLIVGEYLLNFHPGANRDIELYLERNGFEVIEARMTDVIRKTYFYKHAQVREYGIHKPFAQKAEWALSDDVFEFAQSAADRIACKHPLYEPPERMPELVRASDDIVHHTFDAGEGVLIPAEILHHAQQGCRAFIILQPFGCLPNHIVGRGIVKSLKERYPDVSILPLDYDPDTSQANIENRLQMLIMEARAQG